MQKEKLIPGVKTFADLCDRLAVEVHRLGYFENLKNQEQNKENPNPELIQKWDKLSRQSCELRSALKTEINNMLTEIVANKEYLTYKEPRTFIPGKKTVADVLTELYTEHAEYSRSKEFAEALNEELRGLIK